MGIQCADIAVCDDDNLHNLVPIRPLRISNPCWLYLQSTAWEWGWFDESSAGKQLRHGLDHRSSLHAKRWPTGICPSPHRLFSPQPAPFSVLPIVLLSEISIRYISQYFILFSYPMIHRSVVSVSLWDISHCNLWCDVNGEPKRLSKAIFGATFFPFSEGVESAFVPWKVKRGREVWGVEGIESAQRVEGDKVF